MLEACRVSGAALLNAVLAQQPVHLIEMDVLLAIAPAHGACLPRQRRKDPKARGNAPGTRPKQTLFALKGRNAANQRFAVFGAENQMNQDFGE